MPRRKTEKWEFPLFVKDESGKQAPNIPALSYLLTDEWRESQRKAIAARKRKARR